MVTTDLLGDHFDTPHDITITFARIARNPTYEERIKKSDMIGYLEKDGVETDASLLDVLKIKIIRMPRTS